MIHRGSWWPLGLSSQNVWSYLRWHRWKTDCKNQFNSPCLPWATQQHRATCISGPALTFGTQDWIFCGSRLRYRYRTHCFPPFLFSTWWQYHQRHALCSFLSCPPSKESGFLLLAWCWVFVCPLLAGWCWKKQRLKGDLRCQQSWKVCCNSFKAPFCASEWNPLAYFQTIFLAEIQASHSSTLSFNNFHG